MTFSFSSTASERTHIASKRKQAIGRNIGAKRAASYPSDQMVFVLSRITPRALLVPRLFARLSRESHGLGPCVVHSCILASRDLAPNGSLNSC